MTATATSASRKRTSGLRTSQRTRNIWRASKLGGKTRPTNWSNIFRWYRSSWGRYTQADPIGLRGGPNVFGYAGARPTRFIDPLGLIRVSCCGENLQPAIDNARLRMRLLESTGSENNPNGTNVVTAETACRVFTMFDHSRSQH